MSHTNNYAKYDPYVAEIAAKVDNILSQYDYVLGNVQIPFNVGQAMVKAHERGDKSKFELELEQFQHALTYDHPLYKKSQHYRMNVNKLLDYGRNASSWITFAKFVKDVNDVFYNRKPNKGNRSWQNIQVVYYNIF